MFPTLIQQFKDVEAAVVAGDYKAAFARTIEAQQTAFNILFGGGGMRACPPDHAPELVAACDRVAAACHTTRGAGVAAIGDGTILTLILQVLPQILALFARKE